MTRSRRRRVPEVLQSSMMDCGPAALQAILEGFSIRAPYDWLRARCHTDVDGTSLGELAKVAGELGLWAGQVLVPRDTLLLPAARLLPALAVTSEAAGQLHFVVLWDTHGPLVQVMDPSVGRRFVRRSRVIASMPDFAFSITAERFARWRRTRYARDPLQARLCRIGLRPARAHPLVGAACAAGDYRAYARLDAATRMVQTLVDGGAMRSGREAAGFLDGILAGKAKEGIPIAFWWVTANEAGGQALSVRGAPIVHFQARPAASPLAEARTSRSVMFDRGSRPRPAADDLNEIKHHQQAPARLFWQLLTCERRSAPLLIAAALMLMAAVALVDQILLQGLLQGPAHLALGRQRWGAVLVLVGISLGGLGLEMALERYVRDLGRRLEVRVRAALFEALPRLQDSYLRTRPIADMAQRGHALHILRAVPALLQHTLAAVADLLASVIGITLLFPEAMLGALGIAMTAVLVPLLSSRAASEDTQRARAHLVALDRFYLDALTGVVPIRVHSAETAVRREHEALLVEWARSTRQLLVRTTRMRAVGSLLTTALALALAAAYLQAHAGGLGLLLLAYWAFRMSAAGHGLVDMVVAYGPLKHTAVRLFSPLRAAEGGEARPVADHGPASAAGGQGGVQAPRRLPASAAPVTGVRLRLAGVGVTIANRPLLRDVSLDVPAGQHVAIVGPSGAGKSSLLGLLLGWLSPVVGDIEVDGVPLSAGSLTALRRATAWIDPNVQLWNDTLLQNLIYGIGETAIERLPQVIESACLHEVLQSLPASLQTELGESGTRVSGGQGQRVRLARGLLHPNARLVLLDEPFRGLQRPLRVELLSRLRAHFRAATLLFGSHDIADTMAFDRVLVVKDGRIVEDGEPRRLLQRADSDYRALLDAETGHGAFDDGTWKRARVVRGKLVESL